MDVQVLFRKAALAGLAIVVAALSAAPAQAAPRQERAVLAGGCFWGMEAVFEQLRGVSRVVSGFSGGNAMTAHYELVSTGATGHAESVEITFDPAVISYRQLLDVYFTVAHDPTELNRQGPDYGTQYRSAIFYTNDAQRRTAESTIRELTAAHRYSAPIVTQVVPFTAFYAAEAYHQHYLENNPDDPYIVTNDLPKLKALRERFPTLLRAHA
ncbi:MAG: peptide-methionine (S)-S-oxide reductase MsrA [Candidatus Eremiobacteraeota bacterium]|nr:peptide-methionine (S)-S-oxide reductase MsrA [Candidatus Eremiobacteraeota bacterium]